MNDTNKNGPDRLRDSYQPIVKSQTPKFPATYQPVGPLTEPKPPQGGSGVPPGTSKNDK